MSRVLLYHRGMRQKITQIPTPYNMTHGREGRIMQLETASFDDGTVMFSINGVEVWMEFEQAADFLHHVSDAAAEAWEKLRAYETQRAGRE